MNQIDFPYYQEVAYIDPFQLFARFAKQEGAILFDSSRLTKGLGCYSFIAIDPFLIIRDTESSNHNSFGALTKQLARYRLSTIPTLPPFQGGVAGYFGYDLCRQLERIPPHHHNDLQFPNLILGFYDLIISFDHQQKRSWIISSGYPEQSPEKRQTRASKRLQWLLNKLAEKYDQLLLSAAICSEQQILSNFTQSAYEQAVKKIIHYIYEGDVYEVNIAQRFQTTLSSEFSPFELYRRLRAFNSAPFSVFMNFSDVTLASASPERFLQLINKQVEARPIKGTRPRGKTTKEDQRLANELSQSEKDRAENIMIVDLLRNDLSKVCENSSIQVPQLCGLESYATVHHLVSVIQGRLKKNYQAVDLLKAAFPCGSVTCAPKIRAMEIIAEIESHSRGPYCGAMGYIGFNGDMDMAVTIRTFAIKNNVITFHAGGAIVADSDPTEEYEETLVKAAALRQALVEIF